MTLGAVLLAVTVLGAAYAGSKVQICHLPPGDPANFHTITVSENALVAHLAHGDLPGSCFENAEALCDDGDACTIDAMDAATETCLPDHPPVDCDDGLLCTTESCDPADGCQYAPIVCDDGDRCSIDACNPINGQCTFTPRDCGLLGICLPETGDCDYPCDGITCEPIDQCHEAGECVLPGECIAGDPLPDGTSCDDGSSATADDQCTGGVCAGVATCPCWTPEILAGLRFPQAGDQLGCQKDYSAVNPNDPNHGVENHDLWMIKRTDADGIVYWAEIGTTEVSYHQPAMAPNCAILDLCRDGNCGNHAKHTVAPITLEQLAACEAGIEESGLARGFSCFQ